MEWALLLEGTREDTLLKNAKVSKNITSAVVLLKGKENWVVDTGGPGFGEDIKKALAKHNLLPEDINWVINTHLHLDHTFNNFLFQHAKIITPWSVWEPIGKKQVTIYGSFSKLPSFGEIKLIPTPGHSRRHFSVMVKSDGKNVVIAGDAIRESIIRGGKVQSYYSNVEDYLNSQRKIFEIADIIIPGHGRVIEGKLLKELKTLAEKMVNCVKGKE